MRIETAEAGVLFDIDTVSDLDGSGTGSNSTTMAKVEKISVALTPQLRRPCGWRWTRRLRPQ